MNNKVRLLLVLVVIFICTGAAIYVFSNKDSGSPTESMSLKKRYEGAFLIGGAVSGERIRRTDSALVVQHFSSITCDNAMKPLHVHPQEDVWAFEKADWLVAFARRNHLAMRGHTLVWHQTTPDWFFTDGDTVASPALLKERMKNHISTLLARYRNDVFCWDVVNEGIDVKQDNGLRRSRWYNILGEEYLDLAFRFAREAAPGADLYYNDYNLCDSAKRDAAYRIIRRMQQRGVPIDGIGFQAHWKIGHPTEDEIRAAFDKFISLGLKIQITELDVSLYDDDKEAEKPFTPELEARQAAYYKMCFRLFEEYKDHIDCVAFWGVADNHTWLNNFPVEGRKNHPLLFDENHHPKQAYYEVIAQ